MIGGLVQVSVVPGQRVGHGDVAVPRRDPQRGGPLVVGPVQFHTVREQDLHHMILPEKGNRTEKNDKERTTRNPTLIRSGKTSEKRGGNGENRGETGGKLFDSKRVREKRGKREL